MWGIWKLFTCFDGIPVSSAPVQPPPPPPPSNQLPQPSLLPYSLLPQFLPTVIGILAADSPRELRADKDTPEKLKCNLTSTWEATSSLSLELDTQPEYGSELETQYLVFKADISRFKLGSSFLVMISEGNSSGNINAPNCILGKLGARRAVHKPF
jgi:hypothetical protein